MNVARKTQLPPNRRAGVTLVELAMVLLLLGIAAALIIPSFEPNVASQLASAAEMVAADMQFVRSLAVSNNSTYQVTLDTSSNEYAITHSGSNPTLDTLPLTMAYQRDTGGTRYLIPLNDTPKIGIGAQLLDALSGSPAAAIGSFEFDALGSPVPTGDVEIWLTAGSGDSRRYLPVVIHAATGLATVGSLTASAPVGATAPD